MRKELKKVFSFAYRLITSALPEQSHLLVLYFHKVYTSKSEAFNGCSHPMEATTAEDLKIIIGTLLENGYQFVNPESIFSIRANSNPRLALITFDDGYFNNTRALPILEQFNVPCLFHVSTWYIAEQRPFWVDVLYRQMRQYGKKLEQIADAIELMKKLSLPEIISRIGREAMYIDSDICRPFTCQELKDFARHKLVYIGNHTHTHAALALQDRDAIQKELSISQELLKEWLGSYPQSIAYPHGSVNALVMEMARQIGFRVGFTVEPMKNYLPFKNPLFLHRFSFSDDGDLATICRRIINYRNSHGMLH
ncbi:MAG: polysaccharide deacetylase family protein [Cytophagales bacterium]|nr:polysaccharide deacetylase family protein [Bernardetiaceae bacterium]MDW8210727.1 polysaccharide deacetylase family protein [Cytophagales bacterium]